jgi:uncharacterized protein YbbC (DUF1343 family)
MAAIEIRMIGRLPFDDLRLPMNLFAMKISTLRNGIHFIFRKSRNITMAMTWLRPTILLMTLMFFFTTSWGQLVQLPITPGADRTELYVPSLQNKKVGIVANHASLINKTHLLDSLINLGINVVRIFSPEHGFRGKADAGEHLSNDIDRNTGIPIISLYGDNKEARKEQIEDLDIVVFDLQDVGVRFYTYISTLTYLLKVCGENNVDVMVLDRPNPNGHYIDGPVLEPRFTSFVGLHAVPVVYGMSIGEYAQMVVGENWNGAGNCRLRVIPLANYDHSLFYSLPVKPSPNLPNMTSVYLYPSLCFFEGTVVSIGRGTDKPFQVIGHPDYFSGSYQFVPESKPGMSTNPKLKGRTCSGIDLSERNLDSLLKQSSLEMKYLLDFYHKLPNKKEFFNNYFNLLAGNATLKQQIIEGLSEAEIRNSWAFEIEKFKKIREKYLLYRDFESRIELK